MRSAFSFQGDSLHLLYLDESGHSHDPSSDFFVLAGFSIFERQTHWLEAQIDPVAARFSSTNPREIEFHGNPMRSGNGTWKGVPPNDRVQAVVDILSLLADKQLQLKVYACVIEKKLFSPNDILARSFEEVASCFDGYLKTLYKKKNPQRGLVILDKSNYERKSKPSLMCSSTSGMPAANFATLPKSRFFWIRRHRA